MVYPKRLFSTAVLLFFLLALFPSANFAFSEGQYIHVIKFLPYTIKAPGKYVLEVNASGPCVNKNIFYVNGITIESNNVVLDGEGHCINNWYDAIKVKGCSNVIIKNFVLKKNVDSGILVVNCKDVVIEGVKSSENYVSGIDISESVKITLHDNIVCNNYGNGIYLYKCRNNKIFKNVLENNKLSGLGLGGCFQNFISNNSMKNNGWYGIYLSGSDSNLVRENLIQDNSAGIWSDNSKRNFILNNVIKNSKDCGILLTDGSNNNTVDGNLIEDNKGDGVWICESSYNKILNNTIEGNLGNGVLFYSFTRTVIFHTLIAKNVIRKNGAGIWINGLTSYVRITGDKIEGNGLGILVGGANVIISNNLIEGSSSGGVAVQFSKNVTISGNVIKNNGKDGISVESSLKVVVEGNILDGNHGDGVDIMSPDLTVLNNIIKNNKRVGIEILAGHDKILNNIFVNDGLFDYHAYHNVVKNNTVNGKPLVYLEGVSNKVIKNAGQVLLMGCDNITVKGLILSNVSVGIELLCTYYCTIEDNTIENSKWAGIWLEMSGENEILNNKFVKTGILLEEYASSNVIKNNTVNGKPLVYLEGVSNKVIKNAGQIILLKCKDIKVEKLRLTNTNVGIELWDTANTIIKDDIIEGTTWSGILVSSSSNNNIICNNTFEELYRCAIFLGGSSRNRIEENNIVRNCGAGIEGFGSKNVLANNFIEDNCGVGISLGGSRNSIFNNTILNCSSGIEICGRDNRVYSNIIENNHKYGLFVSSGNNTTINRNVIEGNLYGIYLCSATYTLIFNNLIENNKCGIYLTDSKDNFIYLNNFVYNHYQAKVGEIGNALQNFWDKDHHGNYWSNYQGRDLNGDGIGDIPYVIGKDNVDRYPCMKPINISIPEVIITSPKPNAVIWTVKNFTQVSLKWWSSSPSKVKKYEIYVNGRCLKNTTSNSCNLTLLPGTSNIKVVMIDKKGHEVFSAIRVNIKKDAITLRILSPKEGHIFWTKGNSTNILVSWKGNSSAGVREYKVYLDGKYLGSTASSSTTIKVPIGVHEIKIVLVDRANFTKCASINITIKKKALTPTPTPTPQPTQTPRPIRSSNVNTVSLKILSPGNYHIFWIMGSSAKITVKWLGTPTSKIKEYKVYLDGKYLGSTTSNSYVITVGPSSHRVTVVAIGSSGKVASSSTTFIVINVTYIAVVLIIAVSAYIAAAVFVRRRKRSFLFFLPILKGLSLCCAKKTSTLALSQI